MEIQQRFGTAIPFDRESIVGHADIAPRWKPNCPGSNFPFDEIIRQLSAVMPAAPADETMRFDIDGNITHIPAFIRNDRTYVQARPLIESMGYTADWDGDLRTVVVR